MAHLPGAIPRGLRIAVFAAITAVLTVGQGLHLSTHSCADHALAKACSAESQCTCPADSNSTSTHQDQHPHEDRQPHDHSDCEICQTFAQSSDVRLPAVRIDFAETVPGRIVLVSDAAEFSEQLVGHSRGPPAHFDNG